MMKLTIILTMALCSFAIQATTHAEDSIEMKGATIIGNRELPKVLYIMPWKKSEPGEIVDRPLNSVFDEVIEPVDREVFRRKLEYFKILHDPK